MSFIVGLKGIVINKRLAVFVASITERVVQIATFIKIAYLGLSLQLHYKCSCFIHCQIPCRWMLKKLCDIYLRRYRQNDVSLIKKVTVTHISQTNV